MDDDDEHGACGEQQQAGANCELATNLNAPAERTAGASNGTIARTAVAVPESSGCKTPISLSNGRVTITAAQNRKTREIFVE